MTKYPLHLQKLIHVFRKLPGVGNKSAERFAFHFLSWPQQHVEEMASALINAKDLLKNCIECGCLTGEEEGCRFCDDAQRNREVICLVASPRDVFAMEQTQEYRGLYHVLGGVLSPLDGKGPEHLSLPQLRERIERHQVKEIIIALDSTLEGDATSLYLKQELAALDLSISRLAFGLPMGSALDYVDGGTLARALRGRSHF